METIGSMQYESLKEAGYVKAESKGGGSMILTDKTGKQEVFQQNIGCGYRIKIGRWFYEFCYSL